MMEQAALRGRGIRTRTLFLFLAYLASAASLPFLGRNALSVALPMLAVANIAFTFLVVVWSREDVLPLEVGTVYAAMVSVYALVPLAGYLLSGLEFSPLSDSRLLQYGPTPGEVGAFAWKYAIYLLGFTVVYAVGRAGASPKQEPLEAPGAVTIHTMGWLFGSLALFFGFLYLVGGVRYSWSYESAAEAIAAIQRLPLWVRQISTHLHGMFFTVKLALLVTLFSYFPRSRGSRYLLAAWLAAEVLLSLLRMGARTEPVLLLMGTVLLYHWRIRPLKAYVLLSIAALLLAGALAYGFVRDLRLAVEAAAAPPFATTNEFQSVFATAFDLARRKASRALEIPWTLYVNDLVALVPSYLLPFPKTSSSEWYLGVIGERGTGVGFTFGVLSESVIGFGNVELLIRGALLGGLFAWAHRWYARRSSNFWAVLLYLWLCIWCYQSFRNTTFYLLVLLEYHVLPVLLLVGAVQYALGKSRTGEASA